MNKLRRTIYPVILAFISNMLLAAYCHAKTSKIAISADFATPVMEAKKKQNAFVKISLTGFELEQNQQKRVPANIAIVLDKSGSMQGSKLYNAKKAAIMAIKRLNKEDIISIVTYDSTVNVIVPATKAGDHSSIEKMINSIKANGSTALFAGVTKGADQLRKYLNANRVNRIILLSDGLANVGPQSPSELGQLGASLSKEGMTVSTIGLGLGYNEDLMTQLAGYSDGNHSFVENPQDLAKVFQYEFGDVLSVVAQEVDITIQCLKGARPVRIIGREGQIIGNTVHTHLNQLYDQQEKFIILEVEVPEMENGKKLDLAKVDVSYNNMANLQQEQLKAVAMAEFSQSTKKVKESINKKAYEDSVQQVANEVSKEAVLLRDSGKISEAQDLLSSNAAYLESEAKYIESDKLQKQKQEALEDADEIKDSEKWNKKRKQLKERQYRVRKQQQK